MDNILRVAFKGETEVTARSLYQYDYGQYLKFIDLDLPAAYEVHFSNKIANDATISVGNQNGVLIPDQYLLNGLPVYAWVFLHTGLSDGETKYAVNIPVIKRSKPTNEEPTPQQQSTIEQTLAALEVNVRNSQTASTTAAEAAQTAITYADNARVYMLEARQNKNDAQAILNQIKNSADLGYITIGETRLTESDLIKLLALIQE